MKYFYCYSYKLMQFLKLQGNRFNVKRYHPNGNPYWVFDNVNGSLDSSLKKWDEYKRFINEVK